MVRAESLHRHALLHISSEGYVRWFFLMWPAMICPAGAEARQSGALATVLDTSNLCCLPASCSFWHVANAFPPQLLNNGEGHCSHHQACLHQSPASQSCRAHKRPPDTQQRLRQLPQITSMRAEWSWKEGVTQAPLLLWEPDQLKDPRRAEHLQHYKCALMSHE